MLGYEREEIVGKKSFTFIHEDFVEYKAAALRKLFSGEIKRFYIEEKRKTKDGSYLWVGCYSNAILDESGNVVYRLDFVTDIENRKNSEEQLLKLDQSKNTILNIVAHDLRSPIVGITYLHNDNPRRHNQLVVVCRIVEVRIEELAQYPK